MKSLTIKILLMGMMLLASACAPYPYYANTSFYGGGQRSYYGGVPNHYTNNYYSGKNLRPREHDGYKENRGRNNSSWKQQHQPNHGGNSQRSNRHNYNGGNSHHWH
ncbi:MAG: hypothetical protein ACXWTT_06390 [Methylobacter sp.]